MTPAIEYLVRNDLVKDWLCLPCSIFLTENKTNKKIVITISEEFKQSDFYSVKHWNIEECTKEQVLPGMVDFRIPKKELFVHPSIILKNHKLIPYINEPVLSKFNNYRSHMSIQLYTYFLNENPTNSGFHSKFRTNWLWNKFAEIYLPNLQIKQDYIKNVFGVSAFHIEESSKQRFYVRNYMKKEWRYWEKWEKYLFHYPGELIFLKEYLI